MWWMWGTCFLPWWAHHRARKTVKTPQAATCCWWRTAPSSAGLRCLTSVRWVITMPGMNGFELALACRGATQTKHIPIVAYTSAVSEEVRKRSVDCGMSDCTSRPTVRGCSIRFRSCCNPNRK
ncbi:MAG: response regulator [Proteobacteria bacterium]|nr:response regulator [Pseudomonadota bacterium]